MLTKLLKKKIVLMAILLSLFCLSNESVNAQSKNWKDIFNAPNANFYDIQKTFDKNSKKVERKNNRAKKRGEVIAENGGFEVYKRWEANVAPRVYPSGNLILPSTTYENYINWQSESAQKRTSKKTKVESYGNWTAIGPVGKPSASEGNELRTGTGRLNFIKVDPSNTQKIFVGSPDGGVWRSTDGGNTWATNTDFLGVIGSCDMVFDPTNSQILYLATGDRDDNRRSIGVLKSTNGGDTWSTTGLTWTALDNRKISRLEIDPNNPLRMIIATNKGTFTTTDGWQTSTAGIFSGELPELKDLELKPSVGTTSENTVYASGKKLFKSVDFGLNWTEVTSGLPSSNISRIELAIAPSNPDAVYAVYGKASDESFLGFYQSLNSGGTFTAKYTATTPYLNILGYDVDGSDLEAGQAFYDLAMAVNPTNDQNIIVSSINQWQTLDGGSTWNIISHWTGGSEEIVKPTVHSDFHAITYAPGSSTTLYSGSDGGIWKSTDSGLGWTDISHNLNISQINKFGLYQPDSSKIMAGMQDNGTNFRSGSIWNNVYGGDGGESFIDYSNPDRIYFCYTNGANYRSDDGGLTNVQITTGIPFKDKEIDFYSSFHQDPVVSARLYAGGRPDFYRSNDMGSNWVKLGKPQGTGNITEFVVCPSNNQIIYCLKQDYVTKSTDGGLTFTDMTYGLNIENSAPVMVTVSNTDPNKVWVVCSGYSAANKVFKSIDGGNTWTNISTGLPNLPINTIVYKNGSSNDAVYIGADIGVYYMDNDTAWMPYVSGLPNVAVRDIEIHYATGKIKVATYGRGVWESDLYSVKYAVTASTDANGTITPTGVTNVISGTNQTYTITPNPCNSIATVLIDGVNDPVAVSSGTYTFTNVTAPHTISVTFNTDPAITWNGTWSNGTGPTITDHAAITANYTSTGNLNACSLTVSNNAVVSIADGHNVTLNGALTVSSGSFTLNNNANLIQTSSVSNTGNIIVKRNSASLMLLDYTLWSSPVLNQQLLAFSPATLAERFYTYNSASNLYNAVASPSTTNFAAGTGYLIRMPNTHPTTPTVWEGTFTGIPNNGAQTLTVTNDTYNAIGNPYPSTISADAFISANNITEALYFWRKTNGSAASTYATYTLAGGVGTGANSGDPLSLIPNGTIQIGQGFIAKSTSTSLSFTNAMRTANNDNQFLKTKAVERNRIWLNLSKEATPISQMMVAYMSNATDGIDPAIDGKYFNDNSIALNSLINNEEFAIQAKGLPFVDSDSVPLSFKTSLAGNYTIDIDHVDGLFSANQNVYLVDNLTGTEQNLKNASYTFSSDSGTFNSRFALTYKSSATLGIESAKSDANAIAIYKQNEFVAINAGKTIMNNVRVFDIRGALLFEQKDINATTTVLKNFKTARQTLVIQITSNDNRIFSKKLVY